MSRLYLPDNTVTEDEEAYEVAWTSIVQLAERLIPGYKVVGFGPGPSGVHMNAYRMTSMNERVVSDRLTLSVAAINAMANNGLKKSG